MTSTQSVMKKKPLETGHIKHKFVSFVSTFLRTAILVFTRSVHFIYTHFIYTHTYTFLFVLFWSFTNHLRTDNETEIVKTYGTKYSSMDQVKFVKDSLEKLWSDMVCLSRPYNFKFLKVVFHKFHLVHS